MGGTSGAVSRSTAHSPGDRPRFPEPEHPGGEGWAPTASTCCPGNASLSCQHRQSWCVCMGVCACTRVCMCVHHRSAQGFPDLTVHVSHLVILLKSRSCLHRPWAGAPACRLYPSPRPYPESKAPAEMRGRWGQKAPLRNCVRMPLRGSCGAYTWGGGRTSALSCLMEPGAGPWVPGGGSLVGRGAR